MRNNNQIKFEKVEDYLSLSKTTRSILEKNERKANKVCSIVLLVMSVALLASLFFILSTVRDDKWITSSIIIVCISLVCLGVGLFGLFYKQYRYWIKLILLITITLAISIVSFMFGSSFLLTLALPLVLSCIYCSKKFTLTLGIVFGALYFATELILIRFGRYYDLNVIIFKPDVVIDVSDKLSRFYYNINDVDLPKTYENFFISFAIPKYLTYAIFCVACYLISGLTNANLKSQADLLENQIRLQEENNLANDIKNSSLPINFNEVKEKCKNIDVYGMSIGSSEASGDVYDFFMIDETHLCFSIGDISSKGMEAVLLMNTVKEKIEIDAKNKMSPKEILEDINSSIYKDGDKSLFVTLWLGIFDIKSKKLVYANSGQSRPLISSPDGYRQIDKYPSNIFLGASLDSKYSNYQTILQKGDRIFLYTSSFIEPSGSKDGDFDESTLIDFLLNHSNNSVQETIEDLDKELESLFDSNGNDTNITMLLIECKE